MTEKEQEVADVSLAKIFQIGEGEVLLCQFGCALSGLLIEIDISLFIVREKEKEMERKKERKKEKREEDAILRHS